MASAVNSLLGSPGDAAASTATSTASNGAPTEQMFLQMLVSQIQNQDPLNPVDGTQFTAQLAQFSELEQLIAIRGDLDKAQSANQPSPTNASLPGAIGGSAAPGTDPNSPGSAPPAVSGSPASQN